ncbi:MAG: Flp family type IVb pilin [Micavibrio sp.]|nr:Flp family type IVb pilin [Micavibrio sp.]
MSAPAKTLPEYAFSAPRRLEKVWQRDDGATAIEYTLIAAGVALAIATAVFLLGSSLVVAYDKVLNLFL